jgi:hypothetical protein
MWLYYMDKWGQPMTLDPELLAQARQRGARMDEAEAKALLARSDYHAAIRRLHLAGAPLREVADAVGLSHQRVQQIVRDSGGTWWGRVWRTRGRTRDAICSWCRKPPAEVDKLVAGPDVFICSACALEARRNFDEHPKLRPSVRQSCSFCGRRAGRALMLAHGPRSRICHECLDTALEVMQLVFTGRRG